MRVALGKPSWLRLPSSLKGRDRRALRAGLALLLPALAYTWLVRPTVDSFARANEVLRIERDLASREAALLQTASSYPGMMSKLDSLFSAHATRLFEGTDQIAATAALARYVSEQAARRQVMVQATDNRSSTAPSANPPLVAVSVEVRAIGDFEGVMAWLTDLERGQRLVQVDELRIAPAQRIDRDEASEEEVLAVTLKATGYIGNRSPPKVVVKR